VNGRSDGRAGARRRRWRAGTVLWLALLLTVAGCGQPLPTPLTPTTPDGEAPTPVVARSAPKSVAGRLLFVRGGNVWLWEGGQERKLTGDGLDSQPRWSPDGTGFLFVRGGDSYSDLWLATDLGQTLNQLTANQSTRFPRDSKGYVDNSWQLAGPSWVRLPDGTDRIVFSSDRERGSLELWILGGPGARAQPVYGTGNLGGHSEGAALSPDGRWVAFSFDISFPEGSPRTTQILVADLETGEYRALTSDPNGSYDPAWSPDGRWIVYASRQGGDGTKTNLWAVRPDGSDGHRLTDGGADRGPAWSPDGDQLAFVRLQGAGYGLFYVDLTAPGGGLQAGSAQPIGTYTDVDPASGISWSR
jgi:TolB protein